jgi:CDP-paratose 2-epimerase
VGSTLVRAVRETGLPWEITGMDNLMRPGSELNRAELKRLGIGCLHGDLRCPSDFETLPAVDWVVDAAANPSVLAGVDGRTSSRQLVEHNLNGTVNMLEYCKRVKAGFILLSTSRVYSIPPLAALPVRAFQGAFQPVSEKPLPVGLSVEGISEAFSTQAPVSLYGATKLASESLALEYGATFDFPVWINRCGVMAGAGQFGRADQGIFAFWLNSHLRRRPLKYIGFDGQGHQVRDCLHPRDLVPLLAKQFQVSATRRTPVLNVSGGLASAMSLRQLTAWCDAAFGAHPVAVDARPRPFDLPWVVLDNRQVQTEWDWQPGTPVAAILEEIATHARENPHWLELSAS